MNIFSNIGFPGVILIVIAALIVFGPNKLPEIGKALGTTLREFKNASQDIMNDKPKKKQ